MKKGAARTDRALLLILLAALLLRIGAVLVLNRIGFSSAGYEHWQPAWCLYKNLGFCFDWYGLFRDPVPSSFLPPLYPWILYLALLAAKGSEYSAMLLGQGLNALLGTATVYLVAQLTRMTWKSSKRHRLPSPHLLAAGTWAIYPPALGHVAQAQTQLLETFLLLLLAMLVLVALRSGARPHLRSALPAGLVLGLLLLTRPSAGIIWACWAVLLLLNRSRRRAMGLFVAVASFTALITVTPWTVRNFRLHGRIVPIALNGGFNFYVGNGPDAGGDIPRITEVFRRMPEAEQEHWRGLSEVERDRALYRLGWENSLKDPKAEGERICRRLVSFVFVRPYLFAAYPRWLSAGLIISYMLILVPFFLALPRCRGPAFALSISAILGTGLIGLAYVVSMRFRATVEPFFVVIGAGCGALRQDGSEPLE